MGATIRAFTAGATKEGLAACAVLFEAQTGIRIESHTTHGHLIEEQIIAGNVDDDIVLLPTAMIDALAEIGLLSGEHRVALGTIKIGAAVRDGVKLPDVATMAAFEQTLLSANSIIITEAPSGRHLDRVFADMGLAETLADRIIRYDMGYMVNDHLIASETEGEIAFGVATEISFYRHRGVSYAGPLPDDIQMALDYEAAMLTRSDQSDACHRLFEYFRTKGARAAFATTGVEI
ncbi:MAG: substrate-binding domain-containing protein [Rhodospirillaceae bacterium]|jgi:molybdate transport system substrate-binding protein|nr:substrate-binding domain-containing protein [Rhodospirillaceae bacterium]